MSSSAVANAWCRALGIEVPKLEAVTRHPEANTFSLLLVALLERAGRRAGSSVWITLRSAMR